MIQPIQKSFAFSFRDHPIVTTTTSTGSSGITNGWELYSAEKEYERLGVNKLESKWKLTNANKSVKN